MKTERVKLTGAADPRPALDRAAAILTDGGLVAIPTETVYGLACRGDRPESIQRLTDTKRRPPEKRYSIHLGDTDDVYRHVDDLGPIGRRLAERCWPGPLTLVVKNRDGDTVGLRVPNNDHTRHVLHACEAPIVAPSANLSGDPPAVDADAVMAAFDGQIEMMLDDGPTPFGKSSTVVKLLDDGGYDILRLGAMSRQQVAWAANKIILFVCTGNTCRSPLAEAIFRRMLADRLKAPQVELEKHGYTVASAGLFAGFAQGAAAEAVEVARQYGGDLTGHLTQRVTPKMLADADMVFAMTRGQMENLKRMNPAAADKINLLTPGCDVPDPVGGDLACYQQCATRIHDALKQWMTEL